MNLVINTLSIFVQDGANRWHPLALDPAVDLKLTGRDRFHGMRRHLRFKVILSPNDLGGAAPPQELCVYLGDRLDALEETLSIPLGDREESAGTYTYTSAPPPSRQEHGEQRGTPAGAFRNAYWTVGRTALTVCDDSREPLCSDRGTLFQTAIRLDYAGKPYRDLYRAIRADVQSAGSAAHLGAPVQDHLAASTKGGSESRVLSLYRRIRDRLAPLVDQLTAVAESPATELVLEHRTLAFQPDSARAALATVAATLVCPSIYRVAPGPYGSIPTHLSGFVPSLSTDTEANRYARWALEQVVFWLRDIDGQFSAYVEQQEERLRSLTADGAHTIVIRGKERESVHATRAKSRQKVHVDKRRDLLGYHRQLERLRPALPPLRPGGAPLGSTATLIFEPRYAELRRLVRAFAESLYVPDVPGGDELVDTDIEPFSELFEIWTFQRTVDALGRLGFVEADSSAGGYARVPIYENPKAGLEVTYVHPTRLPEGGRLHLCYGKVYPRFLAGTGARYGVEDRRGRTNTSSRKDAPDIALEYFGPGQQVPQILVLDASLSSGEAEQKKLYLDTIRSFYEPPSSARRAKSQRIVVGSYCVSPVTEDSSAAKPSSYDPTKLVDDEWGVLRLPPDRAEASRRIELLIDDLYECVGVWAD